MANRVRRSPFRRRRRRLGETYTHVGCRQANDVGSENPCNDPTNFVSTIWVPTMATGTSDPSSSGGLIGTKSHTILGMKFSAEYSFDPAIVTNEDAFAFVLTIWEALVILPLAVGSKTLPAYLPTLTLPQQTADVADRVLWKRITHMPMWSLASTGFIPQLQSTIRDTDHGAQTVKVRARIDDKHGLFYARTVVHDFVPGAGGGDINIFLDFWAKVFYRTNFGR